MAKKKTKKVNTNKVAVKKPKIDKKVKVEKPQIETKTIEKVEIEKPVEVNNPLTKDLPQEKKESKRLLSDKLVAILYLICAIFWIISLVLDIIAGQKYIIDIVVSALLIVASILYFVKAKYNK